MRDTIERFLRGEFYLHLATMFLLQFIVVAFFILLFNTHLANWLLFFTPIIFGVGKELLDKKEGKNISISDIIGTLIGGYLAILMLKII